MNINGPDPSIEKTYVELAEDCGSRLRADFPEAKELDIIRMLKDYGHDHMVAVSAAENLFKEDK
tara:strand:+ start:396 stop:587 length:192 start_codon:yes stop_codon:yes gene_type:complete